MRSRTSFIVLLGTFLLLVSVVLCVGAYSYLRGAGTSTQPYLGCASCNILLISVDSLRADHVGALGYARNTTPHFDVLAKRGALFSNYFTTSFLTPVAEMSLHTGLYPSGHQVQNFDMALASSTQTLAEYAKGKNYRTSAILSSPEFSINPVLKESFARGFDTYDAVGDAGDGVPLGKFSNRRTYPTMERLAQEFTQFRQDKFFLWLPVGGIHWPYGRGVQNVFADEAYDGYFKGRSLDWQEFQHIYDGQVYPKRTALSDADRQYVIDQYDNGVRAFDDFLGEVMAQLDARGLLANTIVIVASEHGEDLGEHGYIAHYDVLDTQIHTPLLVVWPGAPVEGSTVTSFASPVDIFPTIKAMLVDTTPDTMQGNSLAPILSGKEADGLRKTAYIERSPLWEEAHNELRANLEKRGIPVVSGQYEDIAIRTPEWKYILRLAGERMQEISWWGTLTDKKVVVPDAELYDLRSDPLEMVNVADAHPNESEVLRAELLKWYGQFPKAETPAPAGDTTIQPYF